jgi:hypothetical protein
VGVIDGETHILQRERERERERERGYTCKERYLWKGEYISHIIKVFVK